MKYLFLLAGLFMPVVIPAQNAPAKPPAQPLFSLDLLYTGSWEENKTLNNRLELHIVVEDGEIGYGDWGSVRIVWS
jgi:hypothetical protein